MTNRDPAWLEELIRRHHGVVARYVAARLPEREVDDAVAEVFAAAWQDQARVPETPLPWLLACARLRVLKAAGARARIRRLDVRAQEQARLGGQPAPELTWVYDVLDRLAPDDAEILLLDAWDGLTSAELGVVLGCPASTARVRLFRARRRAARLVPDVRKDAIT